MADERAVEGDCIDNHIASDLLLLMREANCVCDCHQFVMINAWILFRRLRNSLEPYYTPHDGYDAEEVENTESAKSRQHTRKPNLGQPLYFPK